jgi:hypothetical protein
MRTYDTAGEDTPTAAMLRECAAKTVDALLAELRRRPIVHPEWLSLQDAAAYRNVAKGLRRLDELCAGEMKTTASLIVGLPAALGLPPEVVTDTMRQTVQQLDEANRIAEEKREAAWRASFRPCAYLLGTETRPSQITIYGMTGGSERWLKIPLDLSQPAVTFASQASSVVRRTPTVPFFGKTIGFIFNYTPDFAVRFDLSGDPVEALDHAYLPGDVTILIGGKEIPGEVFARITGLMSDARVE